MPFIALCPHCRNAKVSAPTRKRGQPHTCPRCNSEFPLEPLDESELPVDYKLPPPEFDILKAYEQPVRDDFASAPTLLASALTGSAVVALPDAKPKSAPLPVPAAAPEIDYTPPASMSSDLPFTLVLVALGVFGVGMIVTQFSYGRFIALPFLLAGIVLGLMALPGLIGREKFGWGAVAANGLGLLFVVFLPSWLGLSTWLPPGNPDAEPKPVYAVRKDGSSRFPSVDAIDAQLSVWEQNDVRIEVVSAVQGLLDSAAKPNAPGNRTVLRITLKVQNVGVARVVPFAGWATTPDNTPKLTAATGTVTFVKTESPPAGPIPQSKDTEVVLLFDPLLKSAEELRLDLSPMAFEGKDAVTFRLPAAMIGGVLIPKKSN